MKKTVTANISGLVFHIEEDAYEKLNRYLDTIRTKFNGADESAEILSDIEARIAELFQEKHEGAAEKVVTLKHVEEVIGILGQPDDYVDDDEEAPRDGSRTRSANNASRRLFRDPDDSWLAGVIGGIGAYFNIDPLILRIIFIFMLLAGFGFLIYIILWVVVPKAESAADRLQMRGDPVTVDNIKKVFEEGKERFREGADTVANEAKATYESFRNSDAKRSSNNFMNFIGETLRLLAIGFVKLIGFILLVVGIMITVIFLVAFFGLAPLNFGDADVTLSTFRDLIFTSGLQANLAYIGLSLFLIVPAVALLYAGIRILFNMNKGGKLMGMTLGPLWFAGLVLLGIVGVQIASDFSKDSTTRTEALLQQPASDVLYIDVMDDESNSYLIGHKHKGSNNVIAIEDDVVHMGLPNLEIETSTTGDFELVLESEARGRTYKDATSRAAGIHSRYQQQDSILRVGRTYSFSVDDKFRDQELTYILRVPLGKAVHFNRSTERILHNVPNVTNTWDREMVEKTWTMTRNGLSSTARPGQIDEVKPDEKKKATNEGPIAEVKNLQSTAARLIHVNMPNLLGHFTMNY